MKTKSQYYSYVIYGLLYLALFAFVGVFNFAFADWDPGVLKTAQYWISTATTSGIYLVAFQLTVNLASDILVNNDPTYLAIKEDLDKQAVKGVSPNLRKFTDHLNFNSKRDVWETRINNKLTKLNNRTSEKTLSDSKNPIKLIKLNRRRAKIELKMQLKGKESKLNLFKLNRINKRINLLQDTAAQYRRKTRKFTRRLNLYNLQLTEDWIQQNLRYIRLTYPQITPQEIITGSVSPENKKRMIDDSVGSFALKRRMGMLVLMIAFNAAMEAVIFTDNPFDRQAIRMMIFQIFMVLVNIFSGWLAGIDGFRKKKLTALTTRRDLLVEFKLWEKEHGTS